MKKTFADIPSRHMAVNLINQMYSDLLKADAKKRTEPQYCEICRDRMWDDIVEGCHALCIEEFTRPEEKGN